MEQKFEREMKMVKKILFTIAVALLVTTANAGIVVTNHTAGDHAAVKVEGHETLNYDWPISWSYDSVNICTIPVKMEIGMYIKIIDCNKKEIWLRQVPCGDVGASDSHYPCYAGSVTVKAIANFNAKLGLSTSKDGSILDNLTCGITSGDVVPGDGNQHDVVISCKSTKAKLWAHAPGDKVNVGSVTITVKPN
jgi:hypothetical protein